MIRRDPLPLWIHVDAHDWILEQLAEDFERGGRYTYSRKKAASFVRRMKLCPQSTLTRILKKHK